ncbi:MAG: OadG family protein [Bacillota bacterium]
MLIYGLKVTLLGMGTVFVALYILMLIIQGQAKFLAPKTKKISQPVKEEIFQVKEDISATKAAAEDEDEIQAVIAAVIAVCGQQKNVIKSITRLSGQHGSVWSDSGRREIMSMRQI